MYSKAGRPRKKKIPSGFIKSDGTVNHKISKRIKSRIDLSTGRRTKSKIKLY